MTNSWVRPYFQPLWATRPGSLLKRLDSHSGTHHDYIGQVSWDKSVHASRGAHHRRSHISYWHCQGPWEKEQGFVTIASQINTLSPTLLPSYCLFCANCCRSVIHRQREGGGGRINWLVKLTQSCRTAKTVTDRFFCTYLKSSQARQQRIFKPMLQKGAYTLIKITRKQETDKCLCLVPHLKIK